MSIKKNIRLIDHTQAICEQIARQYNASEEINYSSAINQVFERYAIFVDDCLPKLKQSEKMALCQAYNGLLNRYDLQEELRIMSFNVSQAIEADSNVRDLIGDIEAQTKFNQKVRSWSSAQRIAVLHMIEDFWNSGQ